MARFIENFVGEPLVGSFLFPVTQVVSTCGDSMAGQIVFCQVLRACGCDLTGPSKLGHYDTKHFGPPPEIGSYNQNLQMNVGRCSFIARDGATIFILSFVASGFIPDVGFFGSAKTCFCEKPQSSGLHSKTPHKWGNYNSPRNPTGGLKTSATRTWLLE